MKITGHADPTHGITTDPITGRRYVLAYVELGTRVVEGLHRENNGLNDMDRRPGQVRKSARRSIRARTKTAVYGGGGASRGPSAERWR